MIGTREFQKEIIGKIKETKCWGCDLISYHITQADCHDYYKKEMDKISSVLSGGVDAKE